MSRKFRRSGRLLALAVTGAVLGVAGPIGSFGIYTDAQGGGQGCGAAATYNTATGGSLGQSLSPGNTSISGCFTSILTGTTTPAGLTSASSQILAGATAGNNQVVTASAYSAANLAQGEMHLSEADGGEGEGFAEAMMWDTLTFNIPGATNSTTTPVELTFSLDGLSAGASNNEAATSFAVGPTVPCLCTGNTNFWGFNAGNSGVSVPFGQVLNDSSFATWTLTSSGDIARPGFTTTATVNLQGASPTLGFAFDVEIFSESPGGSLDFSNTGKFSITVPQGTGFTSASTVFLTAPEPSTLVMCGLVLAAAGWKRRQWRCD